MCVQKYRPAISTITDWRVEDRLFDRDEFYDGIIKMFHDGEDEDPDWVKDTFEWWNVQVFWKDPEGVDDSDNLNGPSTLKLVRQQRKAQKASKPAVSQTEIGKLPLGLPILTLLLIVNDPRHPFVDHHHWRIHSQHWPGITQIALPSHKGTLGSDNLLVAPHLVVSRLPSLCKIPLSTVDPAIKHPHCVLLSPNRFIS
ncbi:hypothetical protein GALMADRAFT_149166 [Galerina marginata CBS 339.88]|uniref:Uncharacterized protein n=1 Tax=Galerina marginata (strain CBS 339.88) TaxID=685588 RepID=A0A067SDT5_GALM3|nr:hypothetical protein GALMADRAFT_149166 [Galerina marginata CBS 339.88]